ncbi:MAG: hypothetical protein KW804_02645, partial [Candidatus Doudnabacteria bacterium]|nr:hypothetical protein [Candidatus Doudnabacteria bacterium]
PLSIPYNTNALLSWNSTNANPSGCNLTVSINGGGPINTGWISINETAVDTTNLPYNTVVYSIVCNGPGGTSPVDSVTINLIRPPTCTGAFPDGDVVTGTSGSRLTWATGVTASPGDTVTGVGFFTWTDTGGQDDMVSHPGVNIGGGQWNVNIPLAAHTEVGTVNVHVYIHTTFFPGIAAGFVNFCDFANFTRSASGTITVTTNVVTNWTLNSPTWSTAYPCSNCPLSGFTQTYTDMPIGSYNLTGVPALFGYGTPVVSPAIGSNQTLSNSGTIAWTITYPLQAPTINSVTSNCKDITITWTDNSANETGFQVLRSTIDGGPYSIVGGNRPANSTSYVDVSPPTNNIRYYYRVQSFISSPAQSSQSAQLSVFHAVCAANLTSSSKTISKIGTVTYVPDMPIIDGDLVTWRVVIRNTGTADAVITKLCDYPSSNIKNLDADFESGPLSLSGNPDIDAAKCPPLVTGGDPGWHSDLKGTLPIGQNSSVTVESDFIGNGEKIEVCSNTAVITFNDSEANGKRQIARFTRLCNKAGGGVPDFDEVAPS